MKKYGQLYRLTETFFFERDKTLLQYPEASMNSTIDFTYETRKQSQHSYYGTGLLEVEIFDWIQCNNRIYILQGKSTIFRETWSPSINHIQWMSIIVDFAWEKTPKTASTPSSYTVIPGKRGIRWCPISLWTSWVHLVAWRVIWTSQTSPVGSQLPLRYVCKGISINDVWS